MPEDELYHNGIKGQRWGFRRFQYEDGSLTPEGRLRYGVGEEKRKAKLQIARDRENYKILRNKDRLNARLEIKRIRDAAKNSKDAAKNKSSSSKSPKVSSLSDEELRKRVERLRLENEYLERVGKLNQKPKSKFATYIKPGLEEGAKEAVKLVIKKAVQNAMNKATGGNSKSGEGAARVVSDLSKEMGSATMKAVKDDVADAISEVGSTRVATLSEDESPFFDPLKTK